MYTYKGETEKILEEQLHKNSILSYSKILVNKLNLEYSGTWNHIFVLAMEMVFVLPSKIDVGLYYNSIQDYLNQSIKI